MKPEQQRIAIAEACGWRLYGSKRFGVTDAFPSGPPQEIPDYLNDLNAMHEAEKVLEEERSAWDKYCDLLGGSLYHCAHATASQRAEAFLRTLNLWTE